MNQDSFSKIKLHQRQLIINKQVQGAIMIYSIVLGLAVGFSSRILDTVSDEQTFIFTDPLYSKILVFSLVFVFFLIVLLYGFYLTNRIAGPLYRLKVQMEALANGQKVDKIRFRESDFFKEFVPLFNRIAESRNDLSVEKK